MLLLIAQKHKPETCPIDAGGPQALHERPENVPGLKIVAAYGDYARHIFYYVVETDDYEAIKKFLLPGFSRCTTKVTPVSEYQVQ